MVERLHVSIISVRGVNVKSNLIPCAVIFHVVDNIEMMTLGAIHLVQIEMVEKCLPIALTIVVTTLERLLELVIEGARERDHAVSIRIFLTVSTIIFVQFRALFLRPPAQSSI